MMMCVSLYFRKMLKAALTLTLVGAVTLCAVSLRPVYAAQDKQPNGQGAKGKLGIRLRSFVIGASGTLNFEPTMEGGVVRLTALGLPTPQVIMPNALAYVIFAVAPNSPTIRVGELPTDANGNGGLEFPRPASFQRYSVVVSAEPTPSVESPKGTMVFATQAGAVKAFYGVRNTNPAPPNRNRLKNFREYAHSRRATTDFYFEVDATLKANNGRILRLIGEEIAPDAQGLARVTTHNNKGYLRAIFKNVPSLETVKANSYILWAIEPSGRIVYMGSLPSDLKDTEVYVRAGSFQKDDYDLFVTAEMRRPAARPSTRRALSTLQNQSTEDRDILR